MAHNLYAQLEARFRAHAATRVLRMDGRPDWRYADLEAQASRAAGALVRFGVAPGDRVVAQTAKSAEAVALYLGCLKAGAVYVPLNTAYTPAEVDYFLGDAEPALFVAQPGVDAGRRPVPTVTMDAEGRGTFQAAAAQATPLDATVPRAADDLAAIVYTSGTTGRSKGAMLSHGNLRSNAAALIDEWGFAAADVQLHALPIFHVHGLFVALHCAFLSGSSMAFLPRFDVDACLAWLPRCTVMMGVPTFYTRLLASDGFTRAACEQVRLFISGSAPLAEQTFAAFAERTGQRILERYGMSETLMNTSNPLHGERVAGTVGFPLPGVEARVVTDTGEPLPAGAVGGIEVRGPNVFRGYWRMPDKTAAEFRPDGFFRTGDLGALDGEGRLSIVGRAKDLVISGGYNVYPKEVERLIDAMPGVAESAVIGVPHPDFGEGVVAVVQPVGEAVTLDAVRAALAGQLAGFKQPKRVVCVAALPRNAMGKVQKNVLRERFAGLLAADA